MIPPWKARFFPQVHEGGAPIDLPEGETDWDLSYAEAVAALPEAQDSGGDLDYLRDHLAAPEWVRNWDGPFRVELIDPMGFSVY